jgi:Tol biopolymer transport system component
MIRDALFSRANLIRLALSAAISALVLGALLALGASSAREVNLARVMELVTGLSILAWLTYLVLQVVGAVIRAARFRLLVAVAEPPTLPGRWHFLLVTFARNMAVDLLPARSGELLYVALLNRGFRVPSEICLSSLATSTLLDVAVLVVVVVAGGAFLADTGPLQDFPLLVMGIAVVVITVIGWAVLFPGSRMVATLVRRMLTGRPDGAGARLAGWLERLSRSIHATAARGVLVRAVALTVGVRVVKYSALMALLMAVLGQQPETAGAIAPELLLAALIAAELAASLPLPTLLSFGTYEAGGAMVLAALGMPLADAALTLFAVHIASQTIDYLLGGGALVLLRPTGAAETTAGSRLRWSRLGRAGQWVTVAVVVIAAVAFGASQVERYLTARYETAPPPGQALDTPVDRQALAALLDGRRARVVWSSNRFGQHDIVMLELPSMTLRRLTDHPHAEYYARFSPDGRQVVFARSQQPWVSQRDARPWDIYRLDLVTGEERLVVRNGVTPHWSGDGESIIFQRGRGQIVRIDLESGRLTVLATSGQDPVPGGVEFQTPSLSPDGSRLALTLRGAQRMTAVISGDGLQRIGNGCQITWAPDNETLYFVEDEGGHDNVVYRMGPNDSEPQVWINMRKPFLHEYFPKLSDDGRFLVLGASRGDHEHDSADYEIFLLRADRGADEAVRLTFHTGNDNWPDIQVIER